MTLQSQTSGSFRNALAPNNSPLHGSKRFWSLKNEHTHLGLALLSHYQKTVFDHHDGSRTSFLTLPAHTGARDARHTQNHRPGLLHMFPPELRNSIYSDLVDDERAIVLPEVVELVLDSDARKKITRSATEIRRIGVSCMSMSLKRLCKKTRAEYLKLFIDRTLNLQVGGVVAVVLNFNFDNLIDSFLTKLTASSNARLRDVVIELRFVFDKDFAEHLIDARDKTSLSRWLQYRDQTEAQGHRVPLTHVVQYVSLAVQTPIYAFLNIFQMYIYANRQSAELDQIIGTFREYFNTFRLENAPEDLDDPYQSEPEFDTWDEDSHFGDGESEDSSDSEEDSEDDESDHDDDVEAPYDESADGDYGEENEAMLDDLGLWDESSEGSDEDMMDLEGFQERNGDAGDPVNMSSEENFTDEDLSDSGL